MAPKLDLALAGTYLPEFGISHEIMFEFLFEKQTVTYQLDVVSL